MPNPTKADLSAVFTKVAGRDAQLSQREFKKAVHALGLPTSKSYCATLFGNADSDGSKTLDHDEFISIFYPDGVDEDDGFDEDDARAVFNEFSRGDGSISKRELRRALHSLGYSTRRKRVQQMWDEVDSDGNESLDEDEFIAFMRILHRDNVSTAADDEDNGQAAGMFGGDVPVKTELRKALFIGINYTGTGSQLRGCINDVRTLKNTLDKSVRIPIVEAQYLVDDSSFSGFTALPTRANIEKAMKWLVSDLRTGEAVLIHYSGHGGTAGQSATEKSGFDQCICPLDYSSAGNIVDDYIHATLVEKLPVGCRMTAIFDCCHSGSMMDLPFAAVPTTKKLERVADDTSSIGGTVVMISGCRDDQTSADAYVASNFTGALTFSLTSVLQDGTPTAIVDLLIKTLAIISQHRWTQVPQLSCSHEFDLNSPFSFFGATVEEL